MWTFDLLCFKSLVIASFLSHLLLTVTFLQNSNTVFSLYGRIINLIVIYTCFCSWWYAAFLYFIFASS